MQAYVARTCGCLRFRLEPCELVRSVAIDKLKRCVSGSLILALLAWELMVPCTMCLALAWLHGTVDIEQEHPCSCCCRASQAAATETDDRVSSAAEADQGSPLSPCPGCSDGESNVPCCPVKVVYDFGGMLAFAIDMSDGRSAFEQPSVRPHSLTLDAHYPPPRA